jgi:hypothetical protein
MQHRVAGSLTITLMFETNCPAAAEALREAIGTAQGVELGRLLVLERLEVIHLSQIPWAQSSITCRVLRS